MAHNTIKDNDNNYYSESWSRLDGRSAARNNVVLNVGDKDSVMQSCREAFRIKGPVEKR